MLMDETLANEKVEAIEEYRPAKRMQEFFEVLIVRCLPTDPQLGGCPEPLPRNRSAQLPWLGSVVKRHDGHNPAVLIQDVQPCHFNISLACVQERLEVTKFFIKFLAIIAVLFAAELTPPVQDGFVIPFTSGIAQLCSLLMQLMDDQVRAQGKLIWSVATGFGVSIEAGCNGVEAGIVLMAAMIAFPAAWLHKLAGIGVGLLTVQALNVVRIITLFYIGQWNKTLFEWAHLYIWQALIMLDVLFVMLLWLRWLGSQGRVATERSVE
jgi:exosortase H (IPTLxxWG-CTERM-specific)